jgi:hypothetical protein
MTLSNYYKQYSFISYTTAADGRGTHTKNVWRGTYTTNESTATGQQQQDVNDVNDVYKNAKKSGNGSPNDTPTPSKKKRFRIGL